MSSPSAPALTDRQLRAFHGFASQFDAKARVAMHTRHGSPEPLRLVLVGASPQRWACVAWREPDFDARVLESLGASGATSFPWAHGPGVLGALARGALASRPRIAFSTVSALPGSAGSASPNAFSAPRSGNFRAYFATDSLSVEEAAAALLSEMPGSWLYCAQGLKDRLPPPHPRVGAPIDLPCGMEYFHDETAASRPRPEILVDGLGEAFALWLPAAARAFGAPAALSTSLLGQGGLLGLGDILGEANRLARDAPARFRSMFAAAIAEVGLRPGADSALALAFVDSDRRASLEHALAPGSPSAKGPRL